MLFLQVISFMPLLSNYCNIGSESYFLNGPLFNYKLILKYSYSVIFKDIILQPVSFPIQFNYWYFLNVALHV